MGPGGSGTMTMTTEERLAQAIADRDYWREQMTAAAPCVDEIRRLTRRVVRGGTGCALDPTLAVDTAIATLDGMMVSIERIASVRDAARAEADALRAQVAEARAIIAGRTVAPDDAEIAAHAAAGGSWRVRWSAGSGGVVRSRDIACELAREARDATSLSRVGRWWPLSATGEPTTWPVGGGE